MTSNYELIRNQHEEWYGTRIGDWGADVLADRYDEKSHFIYELLQNTEDALKRRHDQSGSKIATFTLDTDRLSLRHYGKPFDEEDVRAVCSIARSTKDLTSIGRFGLGFKSVFTYSERPEIHSGAEDFMIQDYVMPHGIAAINKEENETVISIPFRSSDEFLLHELRSKLKSLGPEILLFLRELEQIKWSDYEGNKGAYSRHVEVIDKTARRVSLHADSDIRTEEEKSRKLQLDEKWLVFSKEVYNAGEVVGFVELAWLTDGGKEGEQETLLELDRSYLYVYFPTVIDTHLGFLVQGPYRTTSNRDNVPWREEWNRLCIESTSELLVDALIWLRNYRLLDLNALSCLPISRTRFSGGMFEPLYHSTVKAFCEQELVPVHPSGYKPAQQVKISSSEALKELISSEQLTQLFNSEIPLFWLADANSLSLDSEVETFLADECSIESLSLSEIVPRLTPGFLTEQSDEWMRSLYELLNTEAFHTWYLKGATLLRLENGSHVSAFLDDVAQAYLPASYKTEFPTIKKTVCNSPDSLRFLRGLGLAEPDLVDNVIHNIIPRYKPTSNQDRELPADKVYEEDIRQICKAYRETSGIRVKQLVGKLKNIPFVLCVDMADGKACMARPTEVCLWTKRLYELLNGIDGILLTNRSAKILLAEDSRTMLEACGASRELRHEYAGLSWTEMADLRKQSEQPETSNRKDDHDNKILLGLEELLILLPSLPDQEQVKRASLLWEELSTIANRRGPEFFKCTYSWTYHGKYSVKFEPKFIGQLNACSWIPDGSGGLVSPSEICFSALGWKPNNALNSSIKFKSESIDILANELNLDSKMLGIIAKLFRDTPEDYEKLESFIEGLVKHKSLSPQQVSDQEPTSMASMNNEAGDSIHSENSKLDKEGLPSAIEPGNNDSMKSDAISPNAQAGTAQSSSPIRQSTANTSSDTQPLHSQTAQAKTTPLRPASANGRKTQSELASTRDSKNPADPQKKADGTGNQTTQGYKEFVSFISLSADSFGNDLNGLAQEERLRLEEEAILLIMAKEPGWSRTPLNNIGFDLYRGGTLDAPNEVCEVKSMSSTLADRPVAMSRAQFECAQRLGSRFWLYVVERAGTNDAGILRIPDPVGKTTSYSIDRGWRSIAIKDTQASAPLDKIESLIAPAYKALLENLRNTSDSREFIDPDVGFELTDEKGAIVAYAELAWPTQKMAIVDTEEDLSVFEAYGWQCWASEEGLDFGLHSGLRLATVEALKPLLLK
ncbi:sacsin N-terminal ATP-binding-like domain-containing protein [Aphanothece stagnina]